MKKSLKNYYEFMKPENRQKPILIFDLDDTLFATAKFIKYIKWIFKRRLGVDEQMFASAYKACHDKNGCWNPKRLANELRKINHNLSGRKILAELDFLLPQAKRFVYPDVAPVLKRLSARQIKLILISFGPKEFQADKIKYSGLAKFFDKIIFDCVDLAKIEKISKVFNAASRRGSVYFIEDKGSGTEAVKRANPGINSVWMKRPDGRYLDQQCRADFVIKNLKDLEKIVKCGGMKK